MNIADQLERDGVAVLPDVLNSAEIDDALARLRGASRRSEERGMPAFVKGLDPNASNVRGVNSDGSLNNNNAYNGNNGVRPLRWTM